MPAGEIDDNVNVTPRRAERGWREDADRSLVLAQRPANGVVRPTERRQVTGQGPSGWASREI